jgi:undecaprenyl-diphosphatase
VPAHEHSEDHHLALFTDHRWAVAGALAMYLAAAALLVVMAFDAGRDAIQPLDDAWYDLMVWMETGPLTFLAEALDLLGSAAVQWAVRLAVAVWLAFRRRWVALTAFVTAVVLVDLAIGPLKEWYARPRPPDPLVETTNFSFPSGHAMATAVTVVAIVTVLFPPGPHRRLWEVRAATVAFLMAASRTYLRAHWLTDTVTGVLLGAASAIALGALVQWWRLHRRRPGSSVEARPDTGPAP